MTYAAWREYFERLTAVPEHAVPLAEAALVLASDEYPDLDVPRELERLHALAEPLPERLPADRAPLETVRVLTKFLFEELGFRGDMANYYDPRNSYLNDVLDRRMGLPISLSVIVITVAERLGLPIVGVGLPGHFVVKWADAEQQIVFDPFHRGEILDEDAILRRVRATAYPGAEFRSEWLDPVGAKYILRRMLSNLKAIFLQAERVERVWQVVDKLLILDPLDGDEIRDLGLLSLRLGAYRQAAISLEEYLLAHADAPDAEQVRVYLRAALEQVERLN